MPESTPATEQSATVIFPNATAKLSKTEGFHYPVLCDFLQTLCLSQRCPEHLLPVRSSTQWNLRSLIEFLMQTVSQFGFTYELLPLRLPHRWVPERFNRLDLELCLRAMIASAHETNLEVLWKMLSEDVCGWGRTPHIHQTLPKREHLVVSIRRWRPSDPSPNLRLLLFSSIERFTALLLEHFAGTCPFGYPRTSARIIPLSERHIDYCEQVRNTIAHRPILELSRSKP